jgi:hypothetical protein
VTFAANADGARFTVVVNHFKSKGSDCNHVGDPDVGDGQANCNLTRTAAAEAMVDWLATDPTSSGDTDFLILRDLNSYAMEDPITVFRGAGYVDTIADVVGDDGYSFVFDGMSGYLDHALASPGLAAQVTGVTEWRINADEPIVLDYNIEFKTANHVTTLYAADQYRSSHHAPVLVGLGLNAGPTVDGGGPYSVIEGASVTVTATGSDPDGDTLTHAWDLDNDGTLETAGQSATFSAAAIEAPATRTISVRATDPSGLTATDAAVVNVIWDFDGFPPPRENPPALNTVVAGQVVAVSFSLDGDQGLDVLDEATSTRISCSTLEPTGASQPADSAGRSGLTYDAASGTYTFPWKTAKGWSGTCRELTMTLADGSVHDAYFQFVRG